VASSPSFGEAFHEKATHQMVETPLPSPGGGGYRRTERKQRSARGFSKPVRITLSRMCVFARASPTKYETNARAPKARARKFSGIWVPKIEKLP